MTEQQYNDAIAIYNPNGGHRTGKIYDIRNSAPVNNDFIGDTEVINFNQTSTETNTTRVAGSGSFRVTEIVPTAATGEHYARHKEDTLNGVVCNVSMYVRSMGVQYISILTNTSNSFGDPRFDLVNGTIINNDGTLTMSDEGDGWYRISVEKTWSAYITIGLYDTVDSNNATFDGNQKVELYGFMVKKGGGLYPYSPTGNFRDLTVTGGGGTRINAAGQVEDVVYNTLANSNNISGNANATVTYSGAPAPTGEMTATKWEVITAGGVSRDGFNMGDASVDGNISVFVKCVTGNNTFNFYLETSEVNFNLTGAGSYTMVSGTGQPAIENVGDGWYRLSFAYNAGGSNDWYLRYLNAQVGDVLYLWGFQYTKGSTDLLPIQLKTGSAAFPKIDYSTGQPAFLIEPTRTNMVTQAINLSLWGKSSSNITVGSSAEISPSGGTDVYLMTKSGTGSYEYVSQNFSNASSPVVYTASIYLKKGTASETVIRLISGSNVGVTTITWSNYDSGWHRFTVSTTTADNNLLFAVYPSGLGSAQGNVLAYGGQVEAGSTATSLIPTNGSAVTRTYSYAMTTNLPDMRDKTVYADFYLDNYESSSRSSIVHIGYTADPHRYQCTLEKEADGQNMRFYVRRDNTNVYSQLIPYTGGRFKVAMVLHRTGGYKLFINGSLVATLGADVLAPLGVLVLGNGNATANTSPQYYEINRATLCRFYDVRALPLLTDAEAIDLTTI